MTCQWDILIVSIVSQPFPVYLILSLLAETGIADPGVRDQIFTPMKKNEKGLMEVDGSFLTVNDMIQCDTSWTEEVYHDFHSYVRGKMKNSLMGFSSSFGNDLEIPYKPYLALPITVNFKLPTLFSRSSSRDDDIDRLKRFFMEEEGSIAISAEERGCLLPLPPLSQPPQVTGLPPWWYSDVVT